MAYFSTGVTKDKLSMLYFLHALGLELTRDQIVTLGLQCDIMPYFDMQDALTKLEEVGAIAALPRSFGMAYCVTPVGEQALELFGEELPLSLRNTLTMHAEENRQAMKNRTQYAATITDLPNGPCQVLLRAREKDYELLSLSVTLPDRESAEKARDGWCQNAPAVYRAILENILRD